MEEHSKKVLHTVRENIVENFTVQIFIMYSFKLLKMTICT